jgi:hypothetical protein
MMFFPKRLKKILEESEKGTGYVVEEYEDIEDELSQMDELKFDQALQVLSTIILSSRLRLPKCWTLELPIKKISIKGLPIWALES